MKTKIISLLLLAFIYSSSNAQRNCAQPIMIEAMEATHPGYKDLVMKHRSDLNSATTSTITNKSLLKTTSVLIPVIFHFVIDSSSFKALGGISGIDYRVKSQMTVINNDFNGSNVDNVKVPSVWSSLYANIGIRFGLAKIAPDGSSSIGYTIKIVPDGSSFDATNGGKAMKFSATGGTDNWDNTKYLNIWVGNLKYAGKNILGATAPPTYPGYTKPEYGIVIHQYALGVRTSFSQPFITNIDKGRTLTHELGHFFQLNHTWGDDEGLCFGSGGLDDEISDTPVEADATFGDPIFPRFDVCTPTGNGIMFMNYMDYTNDSSMYMFTTEQAARMWAEVNIGGNSYTLTLNDYLSIDTQQKEALDLKLFPNPTKGFIILKYDFITHPLKQIVVYNLMGQKLIDISNQNINSIDMSSYAKGLYFVHCYFEKETIKEKIIID